MKPLFEELPECSTTVARHWTCNGDRNQNSSPSREHRPWHFYVLRDFDLIAGRSAVSHLAAASHTSPLSAHCLVSDHSPLYPFSAHYLLGA
jgi:hypothetical protein